MLYRFLQNASMRGILFFLAVLAFLESLIVPIPVDIFTLWLSSLYPKDWKHFFFVATIFSVLGALFAYAVGMYFSPLAFRIVHFFHYEEYFQQVGVLFQHSSFLLMFVSAFTPIPYKVFTLGGGVFHAPLIPFVSASVLGRGLRFFLESYLGMKFGERMGKRYMKKVNQYSLVLVAILIGGYFLFRICTKG